MVFWACLDFSVRPIKISSMKEQSVLRGQTALITGAAKRIGRAVTLALARQGVNTIIHYNTSQKEALALESEAHTLGVKAWSLKADLAEPSGAQDLWNKASDTGGSIDILVNNASIFPQDRLTDFTAEDLSLNINVNALAPVLLSRAFAAQERDGVIVNLLDCRIVDYDSEHVAYHLSKRMLFSLTKMMALEFAPRIRVNAVAPGLILSPAERNATSEQDQDYLQRMAGTNPLSTWGRPEDITQALLFLLQSRFITGQVIYVDGGRFLKGCLYG